MFRSILYQLAIREPLDGERRSILQPTPDLLNTGFAEGSRVLVHIDGLIVIDLYLIGRIPDPFVVEVAHVLVVAYGQRDGMAAGAMLIDSARHDQLKPTDVTS
jgi:hypothetical protein